MANAPDTSSYLLQTGDQGNLPNSSILVSGNNSIFNLTPGGVSPDSYVAINLTSGSTLDTVASLATSGFLAYQTGTGVLPLTLTSSPSINITNPTGAAAPVFTVIPNSTVQKVQAQANGGSLYTGSILNFIPGNGALGVAVTNGAANTLNVTLTPLSGQGTVTSIGITSTTGLAIFGSPITTSGNITVQLPGSGVGNQIEKGDLLVGILGSYTPLEIGTPGQVLTVGSGTAVWETPGGASTWSTFPATTNVNIDGFNITDVNTGSFTTVNSTSVVLAAGEGKDPITITGSAVGGLGEWYIAASGGSIGGLPHVVPTVSNTGGQIYGTLSSVLVGNGIDYTPWGANPTLSQVFTCTAVGPNQFGWADAPNASNWSGYPATVDVNMGGNIINNCSSYVGTTPGSTCKVETLHLYTAGSDLTFYADSLTPYLPLVNGGGLGSSKNIVLSSSTDFGDAGTFLIGDGTAYTVKGTTAPTAGQVITYTGVDYAWATPPTGFGVDSGSATTAGNFVSVANTNITANSLILVSGCDNGGTQSAQGMFYVTLNAGTGFDINIVPTGDAQDGAVTYFILSY